MWSRQRRPATRARSTGRARRSTLTLVGNYDAASKLLNRLEQSHKGDSAGMAAMAQAYAAMAIADAIKDSHLGTLAAISSRGEGPLPDASYLSHVAHCPAPHRRRRPSDETLAEGRLARAEARRRYPADAGPVAAQPSGRRQSQMILSSWRSFAWRRRSAFARSVKVISWSRRVA